VQQTALFGCFDEYRLAAVPQCALLLPKIRDNGVVPMPACTIVAVWNDVPCITATFTGT
jgi:hypothetical protein